MYESWSLRARIALSLGLALLLTVVMGIVSTQVFRAGLAAKDDVVSHVQNLADAAWLRSFAGQKITAARGYLLSADRGLLGEAELARTAFSGRLNEMRERVTSAEARALLDAIQRAEVAHEKAFERLAAERGNGADLRQIATEFESEMIPLRRDLDQRIDAYLAHEQERVDRARAAAEQEARAAGRAVLVVAVVATVLAVLGGASLTRSLTRQIGHAIERVRASSAELEASATQQASGAAEQSAAMNELATTSSELLASSRLIAESAEAVARVAQSTVEAARSGGDVVTASQDSMRAIREQVNGIATNMHDLGRKSQQIGAILELIDELSEQTNILAINATIEAAGAGEQGRRFAVVADEIRKLADRVGASTKLIRGLTEDVRGSVTTTVLATESAAKAVDIGARDVASLTGAFQRITELVQSSAQSAREIELGTRQQSAAVGQVNVTIAQVVLSTRDLEASSTQTMQTATELSALSQRLARIILVPGQPTG